MKSRCDAVSVITNTLIFIWLCYGFYDHFIHGYFRYTGMQPWVSVVVACAFVGLGLVALISSIRTFLQSRNKYEPKSRYKEGVNIGR